MWTKKKKNEIFSCEHSIHDEYFIFTEDGVVSHWKLQIEGVACACGNAFFFLNQTLLEKCSRSNLFWYVDLCD